MSEEIYNTSNETRDKMEKTVAMCRDNVREVPDYRTNTHQQLHNTGRVCVKRYRAATVGLVLLCFLLLMVIILMSVQTKRSTEEKNQLLIKITDQRNQLLTDITNQRNQLLTNISNLIHLNEELNQEKNKIWTILIDGWIYYKYSFYFISMEKKSWTDSRRYCRERNADLIIINSEEEQDFVRNEAGDDFWIGLTDRDEEANWKWVDATKLTLSFWRPGEPNNVEGGENCAVAKPEGWNDRSCDAPLKWICEKKIK